MDVIFTSRHILQQLQKQEDKSSSFIELYRFRCGELEYNTSGEQEQLD